MQYLTSKALEKIDDKESIYVNRNAFNATIAEYEINMDEFDYREELELMLDLWKKVYESEMKSKRIEPFVKMSGKEIKKCFKNYKKFPKGTFVSSLN